MGQKIFRKTCKECGKNFGAKNVRKLFCSGACKTKNSKKNNIREYAHTCVECKGEFISNSKTTKFCSFSCVGKHKNKIGTGTKANCRSCKKEFRKKHSKHFFCSSKCKGSYGHSHAKKELLKCTYCEKKFERSVWQKTDGAKNVFCSKTCESSCREDKARDKRDCEWCNKKFNCKNGDKLRFCSIKCQGKWQSKFRVGINSSNYDTSILPEQRVKKCGNCEKPMYGTPKEFEIKKYCSKMCSVKMQGVTMTSPHRKTVDILRTNRIWNRSEHPVGRYLLDCFLGKGLAIEVQGGYWHGDVRISKKPVNRIQEQADKRDRRKKSFLKKEGITVLYIWEDDIENHSKMCEKLILRFKERNGILSNYHSMNYHLRGRKIVLNKEILIPRFEL